MGYPGDEGGRPPDTRPGAAHRTASGPRTPIRSGPHRPQRGLETPPRSARLLGTGTLPELPGGLLPRPAARRPAHHPPATQHVSPPAPATRTPVPGSRRGRPSRPATAPAGTPERSRATHRRAADPRPPNGADPLRGRDDRGRRTPGRRAARSTAPSPADREAAAARENAWRRPPSHRSGEEIQGGTRPARPAGDGPGAGGSLWSSGAFRTAGPAGRGPVRGFPPAPGAPDPVYPPGQFSPWNSAELRTAAGHPNHSVGLGPELAEPGYSQLAVSDPAADATATQTWAVLDEAQLAGEWTTPAAKTPSPADAGARGPFEAADAADVAVASPPWLAGQPGAEEPAGLAGPAVSPGQPGRWPARCSWPARCPGHRTLAAGLASPNWPSPAGPARPASPVRPAHPGPAGGWPPGAAARQPRWPRTRPWPRRRLRHRRLRHRRLRHRRLRHRRLRHRRLRHRQVRHRRLRHRRLRHRRLRHRRLRHRPRRRAGRTRSPGRPGHHPTRGSRRADPGPRPAAARHASRASQSAGPGCGSCQPACWSWSAP